MKRRDFIMTTGLASMSLGINPLSIETNISTAGDLQKYLRGLYTVREPSVDRIIIGNPETKIKKVGTAWTPYLKTLKNAVSQGINVLVVHEPTFYTHWDLDKKGQDLYNSPSPAKEQYLEALEIKKRWIESNGLVIIRSHDVPDIIKDFGIPFAFGQKLGFKNEDIIRSKDFYNVYRVETDTAANIAKKFAVKLQDFNQPGVAFYGDKNKTVNTVGLGTGCICDPQQYAELNPDLLIGIDDTIRTWIQTTYAEDTGKPLIVINHGTSEEMGMRLLNEHLRKNIPSIEFIHLNQGCSYNWITP
ncbi:MAG TPA: Nif3-like dinuclear metal center hexameric protein [Anaerovoracaceae bacterium]|nr:Nif3-like dinuclear metal center hexameric protein [Anaerovoracaceae bacterium]